VQQHDAAYCPLHGQCGHDANECKVLLDQAQKMKAAWASTSPTHRKYNEREEAKKKRKELYASVQEAVAASLKTLDSRKKKKRDLHVASAHQDSDTDHDSGADSDSDNESIYQFERMTIEDDRKPAAKDTKPKAKPKDKGN
jgi:hypothetical protein